MTALGEALRAGQRRLAASAIGEPQLEAALLLADALGTSRAYLVAHPEHPLAPAELAGFEERLARRCQGEPLAYIRGRQGFWSLELRVSPATLIPRPETELLVEIALTELPAGQALRVADLGTGCGAIALALAIERPLWRITAVDTSPEALGMAIINRDRLHATQVDLRLGSWLTPFPETRFDAILSNPPYVARADPHLSRGDLRFEPLAALTPGPSGLEAIRTISIQAPAHLTPGGWLWLEHGWDQGPAVRALLTGAGLAEVRTWRDLSGQERVSGGRYITGPLPGP